MGSLRKGNLSHCFLYLQFLAECLELGDKESNERGFLFSGSPWVHRQLQDVIIYTRRGEKMEVCGGTGDTTTSAVGPEGLGKIPTQQLFS